ncbi:MAG: hypothetical protein HQ562_02385 [Candidatus Marinimicrobia bacterium]|nr:hypothetical protein [Candidatus Neomarinimicrobiota bacterium]
MTQLEDQIKSNEIAYRFGYFTAILTTVVTIITFGIAVNTPPLAGPFCESGCFEYPYSDIASRFPRDYIWMYPAMLLTLIYVALMVSIHYFAPREKKIYSQVGLSFALLAAAPIIIDYFIQVSVIQPSLLNGEHDGIALLTQFNAHGIFIALEDFGYLMMSVSFLFMAFVFSKTNRLEKTIRWLFIASFILTILALIFVSFKFGIHREYFFEVAAITINWAVLIVAGILLSKVFKRAMNPRE